MPPVVRVAEMHAIDAAAPEPVEVLVDRAGRAVAACALRMLGGTYGRRVVVVAGKGNNGADGRVAAARLRARGVHVTVVDAATAPARLPAADLVVDAAYGTGIRRDFHAPDPGDARVLAVDIASGIDGDTGQARGTPMRADRTITFAAAKPGLFLGDGPAHCGEIDVVDIGLDLAPGRNPGALLDLVDDAAASASIPRRATGAHKWHAAVLVVAGSPGMTGAAHLCASSAQRAGAGMVRLAVPGVDAPGGPIEAVSLTVGETTWVDELLGGLDRIGAVALGPGLGTSMVARHQIRRFLAEADVPVVADGDALTALGADAVDVLRDRSVATVLTPHDGEFARLTGTRPDAGRQDAGRLDMVRDLAVASGAVVVLKGPTTVVGAPDGAVRLVTAGDERLATAGTGDVLTGVLAAFLAAGATPFDAAAAAAHVHGLAGRSGPRVGTVASDVVAALPAVLTALVGDDDAGGSSP